MSVDWGFPHTLVWLASGLVATSLGAGVLLLGSTALPSPSYAAADVVLHIQSRDFSRQKPATRAAPVFPGDWVIPNLPERVQNEAWLLRVGDRVVRSTARATTLAGQEVQRTVVSPTEMWVYYPTDNTAIQFPPPQASTTNIPAAKLPDGVSPRREVVRRICLRASGERKGPGGISPTSLP